MMARVQSAGFRAKLAFMAFHIGMETSRVNFRCWVIEGCGSEQRGEISYVVPGFDDIVLK